MDFIESIVKLAQEDMRKRGILASVTIAQAILESGWGKSELAVNAYNLFGMKANLSGNTWSGSTWDGEIYRKRTAEEDEGGNTYYIDADFRRYGSIEESIADHSAYLIGAMNGKRKRYEGLQGEKDYKKAIQIIKYGGYCTSSEYVNKIIELIETYDLTKFDRVEQEVKPLKIYLSPSDQTGNGYRGISTNEAVQCRRIANAAAVHLKRNGYNVKVGNDGTTYQQRVADSNAWGADVHVPIHTNAGGGGGTIVFAYPSSVKNKYVQEVYKSVAAISPGRNGKDYGVQEHKGLYEINQSNCTCVYVECEFHDDKTLAEWIVDHVDALGEAICKGFCAADDKKYIAPEKDDDSPENAPTKGKLYRVQVGAYGIKANAVAMQDKLKKAGYPAIIKED